MIIPLPVALVPFAADNWPVTLLLAVLFAGFGFFLIRGWARVICLTLALAACCLPALWLPSD